MIWIGEAIAIRLAKALSIELPLIDSEVLIPFGCKFGQMNGIYDDNRIDGFIDRIYYIKHYASGKTDWIQLCNRYSFLKITNQPLSNRYFD